MMACFQELLTARKSRTASWQNTCWEDMNKYRDKQQYSNEKGVSLNYLLIKMLHKILTAVDKNTANDKYAVILPMLDMSQAFERQSHSLGV